MVEIDFSYIYDFEDDERIWAEFMQEFGKRFGVKVRLKQMTWDTAWAELFSFASQGNYPHVSHIGNTWVDSLARMNVLRPFSSVEIAAIGRAEEFASSNWNSGVLTGDRRLWAIPWTAWTYVICYRKDLLEKVGVDPANAFGTVKTGKETVQRLTSSSLEIPWLNPHRPISNRNLLHIAASWIWAAGGDLMDRTGKKVLFNHPYSLEGLKDWLDMYRAVPTPYKKLTTDETVNLFHDGRAAAVLTNIHEANRLIDMPEQSVVREHLGIATVTEFPWTGGGSFVIWDRVRDNPLQEQAALELVKFLASTEMNLRYRREAGSMPSRIDALKETYPIGNPAHETVMLTVTKGGSYNDTPTWRRVEQQLCDRIGAIVDKTVENPSIDTMSILREHLDPLAARLNAMLEA